MHVRSGVFERLRRRTSEEFSRAPLEHRREGDLEAKAEANRVLADKRDALITSGRITWESLIYYTHDTQRSLARIVSVKRTNERMLVLSPPSWQIQSPAPLWRVHIVLSARSFSCQWTMNPSARFIYVTTRAVLDDLYYDATRDLV